MSANICLHHTDAERAEATQCPVCHRQKIADLEAALQRAVKEAKRRDEKWMSGINEACGRVFDFDKIQTGNTLENYVRRLQESNKRLIEACDSAFTTLNSFDVTDNESPEMKALELMEYALAFAKGQT